MGELASESQGSKDLGKWMPICPSGNSHSLFFWLFFFFCHECVHSYTDLQLHLFLHTLYTSGINLQCCNVTGPFKKCVRGLTQKDFFIRIPTELFSSLSSLLSDSVLKELRFFVSPMSESGIVRKCQLWKNLWTMNALLSVQWGGNIIYLQHQSWRQHKRRSIVPKKKKILFVL